MKLERAREVAAEFSKLIAPDCDRLEVAGGIRRGKLEPHDVELVALPKVREVSNPEQLVPSVVNYLDLAMWRLMATSQIRKGLPVRHKRLGKEYATEAPFSPRYYRVLFQNESVDLFAVQAPATWGVIFALRTGDAGFSHRLVSQGWPRGLYFDKGQIFRHEDPEGRYIRHVAGFRFAMHGCVPGKCQRKPLATPEEVDVFRALLLDFVEPSLRVTDETTAEDWAEATGA